MFPSHGAKSKWAAGAILLVFVLSTACWSWAAGSSLADTQTTIKRLNLVTGKSILLKTDKAVTRISVANPAVTDFMLLSPQEIYITGKAAGATNMTLWQGDESYQLIDVEVGFDVSGLKQTINDILPEETDLYITGTRDSVTLMGRVSSATNLAQVMALARTYAPKGKINNLVEVGGVQQVMLEVRVAEMQRNVAQSIGVNFNYITESGKFFIHQLGGLATVDTITSPATSLTTEFSSSVNALFNFDNNGTNWNVFIDALKADGLAKVLAEPTLIALSGQSASFLAGGEFPIPVPDEDGIAIEYKEFGVSLTFTPTVLSEDKINIRVRPEVSELDYASGVELSGYIVPGLTTRKAETVIELADGQSFAIAGLLRENTRDAISKYPLLGDIPILGALFRSRSFQKAETELVIIATPRLVKPFDASRQALPTDFYNEPDDVDIYLLGNMEGRGEEKPKGIQGELDGDFGHAMPSK